MTAILFLLPRHSLVVLHPEQVEIQGPTEWPRDHLDYQDGAHYGMVIACSAANGRTSFITGTFFTEEAALEALAITNRALAAAYFASPDPAVVDPLIARGPNPRVVDLRELVIKGKAEWQAAQAKQEAIQTEHGRPLRSINLNEAEQPAQEAASRSCDPWANSRPLTREDLIASFRALNATPYRPPPDRPPPNRHAWIPIPGRPNAEEASNLAGASPLNEGGAVVEGQNEGGTFITEGITDRVTSLEVQMHGLGLQLNGMADSIRALSLDVNGVLTAIGIRASSQRHAAVASPPPQQDANDEFLARLGLETQTHFEARVRRQAIGPTGPAGHPGPPGTVDYRGS